MGPVEIVFLMIIAIFGAVGYVRGYHRELGVTLLLLVALFILTIIDALASGIRDQALALLGGSSGPQLLATRAIVYSLFLLLIVFITYSGETLIFPGAGRNPAFSLGAGLLNGYLFAGSIWFYMAQANWPFLDIHEPFTDFYHAALRLLPPAILDWRYLIALVVIMLILRVWR
jgi:hypothetical protein